jgi:hypothetical protein
MSLVDERAIKRFTAYTEARERRSGMFPDWTGGPPGFLSLPNIVVSKQIFLGYPFKK